MLVFFEFLLYNRNMKKFYVDKNHLKNDMVLIDGDEFHHLSKVLRTVVNEKIQIVFNNALLRYIQFVPVCLWRGGAIFG